MNDDLICPLVDDASNTLSASPSLMCSMSHNYELLTSETIPDPSIGRISIVCYNRDIVPRFQCVIVDSRQSVCFGCTAEELRDLALRSWGISPAAAQLFHLYDRSGRHLIPLGQLVLATNVDPCTSVVLLRAIWKPTSYRRLDAVDATALHYIYRQCHDDFVHGTLLERITRTQLCYETVLGWVIYDMVAFALSSQPAIPLAKLKRRYRASQFLNRRLLTEIDSPSSFKIIYRLFNPIRINYICSRYLEKFYEDFRQHENGAIEVMIAYVGIITDNVTDYFVVREELASDGGFFVIDHGQKGIYKARSDGTEVHRFYLT